MIRIAVIAPALAVRAGLHALLDAAPALHDAGVASQVVHQAASLEGFDDIASQVDVLVITADAASGPALRRLASADEGRLALLLLTEEPGAAHSLARLPLGAWGALPLDASAEELLAAVYALHQGLLVGAPSLLGPAFSRTLAAGPEESQPLVESLTERESQVLQLLARGLANKQIAAELAISEHTAKFHVSSIYTKLGAANRAEAVRTGIQQGLISL